jgi:type VI secretion system protein ImpG
MRIDDGDHLRYYWEELLYLRRMGSEYARIYPKVAARLELEDGQSPDPHVERLIECFAFLTGRIQANLDGDFPEIAAELLDILYPHYLNPVPSMTIAQFHVDPERGKLDAGYEVAEHTALFAHGEDGAICRFRTAYPVTLWPLEVADAGFESPDEYPFLDNATDVLTLLRLKLEPLGPPIEQLTVQRLRFHLHGDPILAGRLYELLFNHVTAVTLLPDGGTPVHLPASAIRPVGFGLDEEVVPYPPFAEPAYRLLQEYFVFPEKFHFFELAGLDPRGADRGLELLFHLDRIPKPRLSVDAGTFRLGCTPIVNLFPKTTEPIRVDHRRLEYRLVPDRRREKTTEIHSILSISASSDRRDAARRLAPFYAFDHDMDRRGQRSFWHAKRVPSAYAGVVGTEILLSFLDLDFKPSQPPADTVFGHTLCTNRGLAHQLPAGAVLMTDEAIPVGAIVALKKPTPQLMPPLGGQTLWRLISHLSLNFLSLSAHDDSLKALREILRLYSLSESPSVDQQIRGIRQLEQSKVVRRLGRDAWKGFCRGTQIRLTFDESLYVGSSAFLFAAVLNHFFSLYVSTNSFTQLEIRTLQREGVWKQWPPMAGEKAVL